MEFKLTSNWQYSKKCIDGKSRNFLTFYINGVQILKQKIPFTNDYDKGFDRRTAIFDIYYLNGKIYQKREADYSCGKKSNSDNVREVYFPASKNKVKELGIPKDFKIPLSYTE